MFQMIRPVFVCLLLALAVMAAQPALAETKLSAADQAKVATAEQYLQSFTTAKAKFVQINADGGQLNGTFYLWRPGRLRFSYDPPYKDLVVADKLMIHFYDGATGEVSDAPIGQTLADFILRKNMTLNSAELNVARVRSASGLVYITVTQADDPGMGALTLVFREQGYELRGWTVVDGSGAVTSVKLSELQTGLTLPANLFVFKNPSSKGLNK